MDGALLPEEGALLPVSKSLSTLTGLGTDPAGASEAHTGLVEADCTDVFFGGGAARRWASAGGSRVGASRASATKAVSSTFCTIGLLLIGAESRCAGAGVAPVGDGEAASCGTHRGADRTGGGHAVRPRREVPGLPGEGAPGAADAHVAEAGGCRGCAGRLLSAGALRGAAREVPASEWPGDGRLPATSSRGAGRTAAVGGGSAESPWETRSALTARARACWPCRPRPAAGAGTGGGRGRVASANPPRPAAADAVDDGESKGAASSACRRFAAPGAGLPIDEDDGGVRPVDDRLAGDGRGGVARAVAAAGVGRDARRAASGERIAALGPESPLCKVSSLRASSRASACSRIRSARRRSSGSSAGPAWVTSSLSVSARTRSVCSWVPTIFDTGLAAVGPMRSMAVMRSTSASTSRRRPTILGRARSDLTSSLKFRMNNAEGKVDGFPLLVADPSSGRHPQRPLHHPPLLRAWTPAWTPLRTEICLAWTP